MGKIIPIVYLTTFLFLFGESLQPAPRIAIYEDIVCRNHYANSSTDIAWDCKIPPVQRELALLGGLERLSLIVPSVLAIPFAALADKYGHSFILSIALFGLFLEELWPLIVCWFPDVFPIRLIWLHFVFSLIGGGITMILTLLHVIIADNVDSDMRTTIFFRMRAAGVAASVIGYAVAGVFMKVSVWLPWIVGLASFLLAMAATMMVPSQAVAQTHDHNNDSQKTTIQSAVEFCQRVFAILTGNGNVVIILILVFVCQLGFDSMPLMLAIYISKRFGWSFANASFLNSMQMSVELLTLLVLLPVITKLLSRSSVSPLSREIFIARASVGLLAIGLLSIGFAPHIGLAIFGIVVAAFGTGQDSVLRSMVTDMVDADGVSIVYSAITMLRAIGGSVSGPIYAGLYGAGIQKGGYWLGLPFVVAGSLFALTAFSLMLVKDHTDYEPILDEEPEQ